MSSLLIPDGPYKIRVAGVNTENNLVTAESRGGIRGYNLAVKAESAESLWEIRWTGYRSDYMILPLNDTDCACTALTPRTLAAIPLGSVSRNLQIWTLVPTRMLNTYFISQAVVEPGVPNNWTWDGKPSSLVTLSMRMDPRVMFTLEPAEPQIE